MMARARVRLVALLLLAGSQAAADEAKGTAPRLEFGDYLGRVLAANVFVSTTEPGRVEVVKHANIPRDWEAFKLVAAMWRYLKGYDPRGKVAA